MNPKAIEVIKKILSNIDKIEDTYATSSEYYFRYKGITFSIMRAFNREPKWGPYSFYIYPLWQESSPLSGIAEMSSLGTLEEPDMVSYNAGDYKDPETVKLFEQLFLELQRKHSKIDDVFKTILEE
jgi:hypothetical protein